MHSQGVTAMQALTEMMDLAFTHFFLFGSGLETILVCVSCCWQTVKETPWRYKRSITGFTQINRQVFPMSPTHLTPLQYQRKPHSHRGKLQTPGTQLGNWTLAIFTVRAKCTRLKAVYLEQWNSKEWGRHTIYLTRKGSYKSDIKNILK